MTTLTPAVPLVEREDLIQVAREALQYHLRDRVRLVRIARRLHEQDHCPLGQFSLMATPLASRACSIS